MRRITPTLPPRREGPVISEQHERHPVAANMPLASRFICSRRFAAAFFGGKVGGYPEISGRIRTVRLGGSHCQPSSVSIQVISTSQTAFGVGSENPAREGSQRDSCCDCCPLSQAELRPCFRTVGYFTPVHERGTKRDTIDGSIRTSIRQQRLSGFMNRARHRAALPGSLVSPARS